MTNAQFQAVVAQEPHLAGPLQRAAGRLQPAQFGVTVEAAAVVLLFPLVKFILMDIGLPWLGELRRYSELQRQRVRHWIQDAPVRAGFCEAGVL